MGLEEVSSWFSVSGNDEYESAARITQLLACDSLRKARGPALSGELCRLLLLDLPDSSGPAPPSKGHLRMCDCRLSSNSDSIWYIGPI